MNKIKRIWITPYLTLTGFALAHAAYHIATAGLSIAWLSVIVSCGPMMAFMAYLFVAGVSRTSRNMPLQAVGAGVGAIMAIYSFELIPSLYTLTFGFVGVLAYIFWYSDLGREASQVLTPGNMIPDFEFINEKGEAQNSHSFIGKPAIYMFYRGSWCPLCVAQIKQISQQYQALAAKGANIILMSPQGQKDTQTIAKKFNVPFIFGFDKDNQAANALGIAHQDGTPLGFAGESGSDTVFPTVFVTDASGEIIWADQTDNYRVRPEPDTFIQVLDRHLATANPAESGSTNASSDKQHSVA